MGRTNGCVSAWEAVLVALCRSTLARLEALEFILNQGFPKYGPGVPLTLSGDCWDQNYFHDNTFRAALVYVLFAVLIFRLMV